MKTDNRPWETELEQWENDLRDRFKMWLTERGGIVVYENRMFDSSAFSSQSFTPAMWYVEDQVEPQPAPEWINDLPSRRQHKVDHITLDEFDGDVDRALDTFFEKVVFPSSR